VPVPTQPAPSPTAIAAPPAGAPPAGASGADGTSPTNLPADARAYVDQVMPNVDLAGDMLQRLGEQSQRADADPQQITNAAWRDETDLILGVLKRTGDELRNQPPPPALAAELHETISAIGQDLVQIADEYQQGVDEASPEQLRRAGQRTQSLLRKTSQAAAQVQELGGSN
jgi:hypothetical protein